MGRDPILTTVAVFRLVGDVLDRHHVLVLGGIEHNHALGRTSGDADVLHRTADKLSRVGHQHDLVAVLDRERRNKLAVTIVNGHRDDALSAAAYGAILERRAALAVAVLADGQHELFGS